MAPHNLLKLVEALLARPSSRQSHASDLNRVSVSLLLVCEHPCALDRLGVPIQRRDFHKRHFARAGSEWAAAPGSSAGQ